MRVQQIDHVEMFVPDRREAAAWYTRALGCEVVPQYEHWAEDPRGPLMISPDDGSTKLALFEGEPQGSRPTAGYHLVAFRVGGEDFAAFAAHVAALGLVDHNGNAVGPDTVSDHGQALSIYFNDPWGHRLEITTYDVEAAKRALWHR